MGSEGCALPELVDGMLPAGRHPASIKDLWQRFVSGAPNQERRELIFQAFEVYAGLVWSELPSAKLWVNGGFVTYKEAPPKDLDVVILTKVSEFNQADQSQILQLVTQTGHDGSRVQPMGGLIDSFVCGRGDAAAIQYWDNYWTTVLGPDRAPIPGVQKGYVEVTAR